MSSLDKIGLWVLGFALAIASVRLGMQLERAAIITDTQSIVCQPDEVLRYKDKWMCVRYREAKP